MNHRTRYSAEFKAKGSPGCHVRGQDAGRACQ